MAFVANYPIALAPGMGMNAFFAYNICLGAGVPWQTALGLVFWSGLAFVLLTVTGARRVLVRAVPPVIQLAGAVGIGLFIAFIGLQHGGLVRADPAHPGRPGRSADRRRRCSPCSASRWA